MAGAACTSLAHETLTLAASGGLSSAGSLDRLYTPFSCGSLYVRNRIAMAPMTRQRSPDGVPGQDVADYYLRRAKGGVGLIISEGAIIDHPAASGYDDVPALFGTDSVQGWKEVVDRVHAEGVAIMAQLWHVGAVRRAGIGPDRAVPGVGPRRLVADGKMVVSRLSESQIQDIVDSYGRAAKAAVEIGFDGVEIHGAHGYLLDQFFWAESNSRRDAFGGSIANRVRFAVEVVAEIRRQIPAGMPISFRISQWKMTDYEARIAAKPAQFAQFLRPLVDAGVDIFHVSTRRFWEPAFAGSGGSLARWTKELSGLPVIAVGSIGLDKPHRSKALGGHEDAMAEPADLTLLVQALERGDFDLAAVGRALLADPEWAAKIRNGDRGQIIPLRPNHLKELY